MKLHVNIPITTVVTLQSKFRMQWKHLKRLGGLIGFLTFFSGVVSSAVAWAGIDSLPVQDGGRVKPFNTFARETLSLVWGREDFQGQKAANVVFSWLLIPEEWDKSEFILIRHSGLRESLKLENKRLYYSPKELLTNDRLGLIFQELKNKQTAEEKLNPFFQAVQNLENQISAFHGMRLGVTMRLWPGEKPNDPWLGVADLTGEPRAKFDGITRAFVALASAGSKGASAEMKKAQADLDLAVDEFKALARTQFPHYENANKIKAELIYNQYHPFRWAWVAYLAALIFFSFSYFGSSNVWSKFAWPLTAVGMIFHVFGFALRVYILERAPVSNMFETVAWVALGSLLMAITIYRWNRALILPLAANLVATFSLILCDISSSVLDDTLTVLQPVLRDNFWLLTHVVIIVSSYAAFFLAFFIGDILLFYFLIDEERFKVRIQQGVQSIYRSIQVGVVLLAAGVILGGVWADYSWGRFWGWDPKETWAFIALLGYLVILHGRLIGWLRNYGLAAASVISFSLVIMAWYGVNFVLGAGLHTYGFGAGGVEWVAGFVAVHLLFVAYVTTLRQSRLKLPKG